MEDMICVSKAEFIEMENIIYMILIFIIILFVSWVVYHIVKVCLQAQKVLKSRTKDGMIEEESTNSERRSHE